MQTSDPGLRGSFLIWAALPPCVESLDLLQQASGVAEPLVDLRFGTVEYKARLVERMLAAGLPGLTVCAGAGEALLERVIAAPPPNARVILCAPWEDSALSALLDAAGCSVAVGAEAGSREEASLAARLGADFVVASGVEAAGPVSAKTSFILLQELAGAVDIPVVIRGGLGPRGAAAAYALGAAGTILDSQLLLLKESGLGEALRRGLAERSASDTEVIGELVGRPFRLLSLAGKDAVRAIVEREWEIFGRRLPQGERAAAFGAVLEPMLAEGLQARSAPLPIGQGLAFAQRFAERGWDVRQVVEEYRRALAGSIGCVQRSFPFAADSPLAQEHGVRFPVVQGPMALVTDTPRLAAAVAKAGGLPFCATSGLPAPRIAELIIAARAALGGAPFGVGIIGFLPLEGADHAVLGDDTARPAFVTIAGGNAAQAKRLEEAGIRAYLHAPSLAMIRGFLDQGVKGIILEGHEAGGHVGNLGSLILWELAVEEILARPAEAVSGLRVLFAGGIMNARSSLGAAVMAAPVAERGVRVGLQAGTAYLMTEDAVACGAVSSAYRQELLASSTTVLTGTTVNLPNRWLDSPAVRRMLFEELALAGHDLPFRDRKRQVEALGAARLSAALGRADGGEAACVCGQGIAVAEPCRTIGELHEALTAGAAQLAAVCPHPSFEEEAVAGAVAIVGMGCVFPGASGVTEFWDNIVHKRDMIGEVPASKWDASIYFNEDRSIPETTYTKIGGFLEGFRKDPLKFRIPPRSERQIDAAQFLVLETVYQALVDAGYLEAGKPPADSTLPRAETAVFVGHSSATELSGQYGMRTHWARFADVLRHTPDFARLDEETQSQILESGERVFKDGLPEFSEDTCAGVFGSLVAGRVANCFDLKGPAVVMDAACASALAAVDSAVNALRRGQCDVALAGAADTRVDPLTYMFFCSLGGLSAKGIFPFDERADGFVLGEGAGMLVLKRLEDALQDGDRVYAVIRAMGTSSDGRVKGITAPDVDGQMRAFARAYEQVPFSPSTVSLIEAHGTGTWAGDKAEIASIGSFFGERGAAPRSIGLGSVKSMIGHLKTAAGIASLIKTAMALHTRILPPAIHCEQPRKDLDWNSSPCYLLDERRLWRAGPSPRRAGVNAFGFGGINYHAVLEEAPVTAGGEMPGSIAGNRAARELPVAELFILRAVSRQELAVRAGALREMLAAGKGGDLRKLALAEFARNAKDGPSLALVARDAAQLAAHLDAAAEILADPERNEVAAAQGIYFRQDPLAPDDKIAFVYPGQGTQYPGMLDGIPDAFPFVEPIVQQVEDIAQRHIRTSILGLLRNGRDSSGTERDAALLLRPDFNHPAMLAVSMALAAVLNRAGIQPHMVAGHSLGEYAALTTAGVFDADAAIRIATQRGAGIADACLVSGGMVSVGLSEREVRPYLEGIAGFVAVANKNCPSQTVIAGDKHAVEEAAVRIERAGVRCVRLSLASAFHTAVLDPCVEPFRRLLSAFPVNPPRLPVQSNLTGRAYENGEGFAARLRESLVRHMVEPVDFMGNIESMYEAGARLFVEIGPGATLSSFVDDTLAGRPHWTVATNTARRPPAVQLLHAIAFCAALGVPVDLERVLPPRRPRRQLEASRAPAPAAPLRLAGAAASPQPAATGILEASLAHEDPVAVAEYLAGRSEFLRKMAALDFACYRKPAPEQSAAAPELTTAVAADANSILARRVVEFVSRKTGYPTNLIGLDLDVEAELGLDSIKQVEIVREIAQELGLDFGSDARSGGYQITTLRELIRRIAAASPAGSPAAVEPAAAAPAPELAFRTDCCRHVSIMVETPLPETAGTGSLHGKRVALVSGDAALAAALARSLAAAGAIVTGPPGDADYAISLSGCGSGRLPALPECAGWWAGLAAEAATLLDAAQECAKAEPARVRWVSVSTLGGEFAARGARGFAPLGGLGLAIGRSLAAETGGSVRGLHLDFDPAMDAGQIAAAVCAELAREWDHGEIGYRNGKRYAIRWRPEAAPGAVRLSLNESSVVLATGGARGITAAVCQELARRSGARFVLAGQAPPPARISGPPAPLDFNQARQQALATALAGNRQPSPADVDREAWRAVWDAERAANVAALRQAAAEVEYRQCDLLDADSVRDLIAFLRQRYDRIDLVLHGAGALSQKALRQFAAREFVEDMAPKALGTAHLLSALDGLEVGAFVNFSSIAGRWGNAGQSAYAAGHEVAANLTASAAAARGGRWFSIYYGPWLATGMTDRGAIMERLRVRGASFIGREDGATFTADEVERGSGESVAYCGGDFETVGDPAPTPAPATIFDRVEILAPGVAHGVREFDPARDRSIAGHQVAEGVPVVPGFLMMEMMAQAGAALVDPQWQLTEVAEARFVRAGRFPQGRPRTFHARTRLLRSDAEGAALSGEVYSLFTAPGASQERELLHARCRLQFGKRQPAPLPALVVPRTGLGHAAVDASPLFSTKSFTRRQGVWANIGWIHSVTHDGAVGQCPDSAVPEVGRTPCLSHIVALDGGLLMGALGVKLYDRTGALYFGGVRSIRFFAASGAGPLCRFRTWFHDRADESSLEVIGEDGRVAVRVEGYTRLPVDPAAPRAVLAEPVWNLLREHPRQAKIRELLGIAHPFALAQVDIGPLAAALDENAEALVHDYLSGPELAHFETLALPKRRREWLAGRIAAKTAIRMLLVPGGPDAARIRILAGQDGAPSAAFEEACTAMAAPPFVSIAHSGGLAAALATPRPGFGIDVEAISRGAAEVESEFAGPEETALVLATVADRTSALTCLWAAKEACRKAAGAAGAAPRDVVLREMERRGEYLVARFEHPRAATIRCVTFHDAAYAYAVAAPARNS
ncbi:MAG: SDR family NAD(P)-dependent oxidoreductase [Bryobacteraceae bacterium]|jgi:acyl transferase domain-containing protein/NAD(P)H-dependent flavin oxidoreductase YrpB (nitropropane dioxygenase family)/NAD(P)-dependent dehydrogenase (short-subunit alcohol dehydrogenase family)/4'-phosphopantetheinyl transferase EntD